MKNSKQAAPAGTENAWYNRSRVGYDELKNEDNRRSAADKPRRFWLKRGGRARILFVDEQPFSIQEHNWNDGQSWKNWETCLFEGGADDCRMCSVLGKPSLVGLYTIVNCTEWVDGKGITHNYSLEVLAAKANTLRKIQRKLESRETLVGAMFNVFRDSGDKSPSVGDEYEFDKFVDLDKMYDLVQYKGKSYKDLIASLSGEQAKIDLLKTKLSLQFDGEGKILPKVVPFNYFELYKPKTAQEIQRLFAGYRGEAVPSHSQKHPDPAGNDLSEDDIPF